MEYYFAFKTFFLGGENDVRVKSLYSCRFSGIYACIIGSLNGLHVYLFLFFFLIFCYLNVLQVIFTEENRSILHFLTQLCAIIGGL